MHPEFNTFKMGIEQCSLNEAFTNAHRLLLQFTTEDEMFSLSMTKAGAQQLYDLTGAFLREQRYR